MDCFSSLPPREQGNLHPGPGQDLSPNSFVSSRLIFWREKIFGPRDPCIAPKRAQGV